MTVTDTVMMTCTVILTHYIDDYAKLMTDSNEDLSCDDDRCCDGDRRCDDDECVMHR